MKPLKDNAEFLYLTDIVTKKRDRVLESLSKRIWTGTPIDEKTIAYERGFWEGAMSVLNRPDNAEDAFLKALKRLEGDDSQ